MISPTCDVLVVGAGPAGIAAAIHLHWAGRSVQVIDKAMFPRDKCCGDGLTTLALRELETLQLRPDGVPNWRDVDAATLRSPTGRQFRVPLPDDGRYAAVVPRFDLDHALVEHARSIGVAVHDGVGFAGLTRHGDRVDVDIDPGDTGAAGGESPPRSITCRYVVAADGMWSQVRKAVGSTVDGYRGDWHAFRQYARHVTGPAADELIVWFEPDLLPGYAWSFPLPGNRANVGFGVLRGGAHRVGDLGALWRELLQRPHIRAALGDGFELEGRHLAWPIPARVDAMPLTSERVLFVGDAAAATDVMTGEGIGQALETGRLAAESIVASGALDPAAACTRYEAAVGRHLVPDHRMSALLGSVLAHEVGANVALRIVEHSGSWGRRNFARWMFEDEPRAIVTTPRRWHRHFLARRGAYARPR